MNKTLLVNFWRFLILFLVCPALFSYSNQNTVDNLTILDRLTSSVVDSVLNQLSPAYLDTVIIKAIDKNEQANWLVENGFVKKLIQKGTNVFINDIIESADCLTIEFKIVKLGVDYFATSTKQIIERKFIISLDVRALKDSDGKVQFFDNFTEQFTDSIEIADVEKVEQKSFSFTKSVVPINQGYKKYIEPFIVITASAGIVYLFFRLRSK